MPKTKGETDEQWMARIRAAREYSNRCDDDSGTEFRAFMALFHPSYDRHKVRNLANEISKAKRRR